MSNNIDSIFHSVELEISEEYAEALDIVQVETGLKVKELSVNEENKFDVLMVAFTIVCAAIDEAVLEEEDKKALLVIKDAIEKVARRHQ